MKKFKKDKDKKAGSPLVEYRVDELIKVLRKKYGILAVGAAKDVKPPERIGTGIADLDAIIKGGWPKGRLTEIWGPQCLAPETMILMEDLTWRRADQLKVGDGLIGVEEYPRRKGRGVKRRLIGSKVTQISRRRMKAVRVEGDMGETIVTEEHPFLLATKHPWQQGGWRSAGELKPNDIVKFLCRPWNVEQTREAGWLAAMVEAEGSLGVKQGRIGFAQAERDRFGSSAVLDTFKKLVKQMGFDFRGKRHPGSYPGSGKKAQIWKLQLKNRTHSMRFIGMFRPARLMLRARAIWEGYKMPNGSNCIIKAVKSVGVIHAIVLSTSSKTMISDGFFTHNSAGKSSLVLYTIAALQKVKPNARIAYFDLENTFEPVWATQNGVNVDKLLHVAAMPVDDFEPLMLTMIRDQWDLIVIDSVVEVLPEKELMKASETGTIGVLAGVLSRLLPKIVVLQSRSQTAVLMTNQVRDKIGFFFGGSGKSPGGHALFHLDSLKVRVQRKDKITGADLTEEMKRALGLKKAKSDKEYGYVMALKVIKSKVSREGEETRIPVLFDLGIWQGKEPVANPEPAGENADEGAPA